MLGTEFLFSSCVSQALEMENSSFSDSCAIFLLSSSTSRVVTPSRLRISRSWSPGRTPGSILAPCFLQYPFAADEACPPAYLVGYFRLQEPPGNGTSGARVVQAQGIENTVEN